MRISELLQTGVQQFDSAGIPEAELDAWLLLEAACNMGRTEIYLRGNEEVSSEVLQMCLALFARRVNREPVAYILGEREFWSLPFAVGPEVLIPRPETEFLLDRVFALAEKRNFCCASVLDLCCGSGVIAVVLARESARANVVASDISLAALACAKKNSLRHLSPANIDFVCGNLLEPFAVEQFSLVVSNPPYVRKQEVLALEPEVRCFEPHLALDGGGDGLQIIRIIERQLRHCLCPGGDFFMEFGAGQGEAVLDIFNGAPWKEVRILQDYTGRDRVLVVRKK